MITSIIIILGEHKEQESGDNLFNPTYPNYPYLYAIINFWKLCATNIYYQSYAKRSWPIIQRNEKCAQMCVDSLHCSQSTIALYCLHSRIWDLQSRLPRTFSPID